MIGHPIRVASPRRFMQILLAVTAILMFLNLSGNAGSLGESLLFYENCDCLKSRYSDVKVSNEVKLEENGKFGKCFRLERAAGNSLDNGDFTKKNSDSWIYRDNAEWRQSGGCDDSSCLQINRGEVSIPVFDLKADLPNSFSFCARKAGVKDSVLRVTWSCRGKEHVVLEDFHVSAKMDRVPVSFVSESEYGTLRIAVDGGPVIIDNAQLDKDAVFFSSYGPPGIKRPAGAVEIPANPKYFNSAQGAISFWLNVPWFDPDMLSGTSYGIFRVKNEKQNKEISKWGDDTIIGIWYSARKKAGEPKPDFAAWYVDRANNAVSTGETIDKIKINPSSRWHHILYNWKNQDGKISTSLYVDGGKVKSIDGLPCAPAKNLCGMQIGYGSGLNGLLDDFAIFDRPLTENEIMQIYNSNKPISSIKGN